ncbi:hypothetical protein B9Z55_018360 [Caenorhabditis nigoni]|uniref:Receptor L-domain domain-containing protein n=1 Tax=Caenorhabditis nigoni TaxID=1611254 RepID=A0A2G5TED7_9PELO|nr:hypothetical protein B9Z55_018360 [Caenorhabditis nigoni]
MKLFPKSCETVCAYLLFDESTDVSDNELSGIFKNARNLFGFVHVINTNFTNLKFLEGLESLECNYNDNLVIQSNKFITEIGIQSLSRSSCGINLSFNPQMKKLGLPNFQYLYFLTTDRLSIVITNNSPDFCLTIQEINHIFYAQIFEHDIVSGSICNFNLTSIEDQKLCKIDNFDLTNFDPKCQRVFGTVLVNEGDEFLVGKLNNIKWIYGELVINGTKLETIDFLDNLEHVISLDAPELQLQSSSPKAPAPELQLQSSSSRAPAPELQLQSSSSRAPAPELQPQSSSSRAPAPELQLLSSSSRAPAPELQLQSSSSRAPALELQLQSSSPKAPAPELQLQSSSSRAPAPELQPQSSSSRAPAPELQLQSSSPRAPAPELQLQSSSSRAPAPELQLQSSSSRAPAPELQLQSSSPKAPAPELQLQSSSSRAPAPELQLQSSSSRAPAPELQLQSSSSRAPAPELQLQSSSSRAPAPSPGPLSGAQRKRELILPSTSLFFYGILPEVNGPSKAMGFYVPFLVL